MKLSKDHHRTIEEVWYVPYTLTKGEGDVYTGTLDLTETLDNQKFKLVVNDGDGNTFWLGYQNLTIDAPEGWIVAAEDNDDNLLLKNAVTGYKSYTVTATWTANSEADAQWTLKVEGLEARPKTDYTVTLKTNIPESEWPNVYAYLWGGEGDNTVEYAGAWPGKEMNYEGEEDGVAVFSYTFSTYKTPKYVIFGDGTKTGSVVGTNQTDDLEFVDGKRVVVK